MTDTPYDVVIVGGGVAGRSAAIFTARAGLDTLIIDSGRSIVRRNAHLENYPGFPAGVNPRLLLELMLEQAIEAGAAFEQDTVQAVRVRASAETGGGTRTEHARFTVETEANDCYEAQNVIAATKNTTAYLDGIDGVGIVDRGKEFVDVDDRGRTGVDGLYAAGRLAEKPHQAIVCAGHGAEVAVTLLEDIDRPFYHDWVAPDGYFTDRGRELPPGCEEIDATERRQREAASMQALREAVVTPHQDPQETHPSLVDE